MPRNWHERHFGPDSIALTYKIDELRSLLRMCRTKESAKRHSTYDNEFTALSPEGIKGLENQIAELEKQRARSL